MLIRKASLQDTETVYEIVQTTIHAVYPHYYPAGAVDFFAQHHSTEAIRADISAGNVFLCVTDADEAVGTVTVKANEILRLFVLPEHQGTGYGGALLSFAERLVAETYEISVLDVSLAAKAIYKKRGYTETNYIVLQTGNGDFLCYDIMEKTLQQGGKPNDA